ncbi:MAG: metallophosphoesterase family protein [bacterium]
MTQIGIISDTHSVIDNKALNLFKGLDIILHAGDIGNSNVLVELESIAKTIAVYGNTDDFNIRSKTKKEEEIILDGFKIHLSHDEEVDSKDFDIIIKGHTHIPIISFEGKTLLINPGSANAKRSRPVEKPSLVICELNEKKIISSNLLFF